MVSCQWRLTSGPRAGQACGKGKAVFCKTHAPKAEKALNHRGARHSAINSLLRPQQEYAEKLLADNNLDFSKSWIWNPEKNTSREEFSARWGPHYGPRIADKIANPRMVANWLENTLNNSLKRGNEILPQPITKEQLDAIFALSVVFERRMEQGSNLYNFYTYQITKFKGKPLPFFQNRRYRGIYEEIYNQEFIKWLVECINYSPDYTALWNWFLPNFTNMMVARLDAIKQGYDVDAIKEDLKVLRQAYRFTWMPTQLPANRYQQK